jgi:hypothetical protein
MPGRLKVKLYNTDTNQLDVFILSYADQDSCLVYGDKEAVLNGSEPGQYYVVVDGRNANQGDYTLEAYCPTMDPDLIVYNASVEPYHAEAGDTNLRIRCEIQNVGNVVAGPSELKLFYSLNDTLDAGDHLLDSIMVSSIDSGNDIEINHVLKVPDTAQPGYKRILLLIDADSIVTEIDDNDNQGTTGFEVVPFGKIDCSSSVELISGQWYNGNTETDGDSIMDEYKFWNNYTGNEVIHHFQVDYDGMAKYELIEKVDGDLNVLIMSGCNENLTNNMISAWSDTIGEIEQYVHKGDEYFFVADGINDVSGPYRLRVTLPDSCPDASIQAFGDTNRCDSSGKVMLQGKWGYDKYQWFQDGLPIVDETEVFYQAGEEAAYSLKITANECSSMSNTIQVRYSPEPSEAVIAALSDTTFCQGGFVTMQLSTDTGLVYQWTCNNKPVENATDTLYDAVMTGEYRCEVTNRSCTIKSNKIEVLVNPAPADLKDTLQPMEEKMIAWWKYEGGKYYEDLSPEKNNCYMYGSPARTSDRFGRTNSAMKFEATANHMYTNIKYNDPDSLTIALWFKTTTVHGGKLIGLADERFKTLSSNYDRHLYMSNDGKIHFGVYSGGAKVLTSDSSYNDDQWHFAVGVLSNNGMKLYMDGELDEENSSPTGGQAYEGYWKLAYGNLSGWPDKPDSNYFEGRLDDVRIFRREVKAEEIRFMYQACLLALDVDSSVICSTSGNAKIYIRNSQFNTTYQLRDDSDDSPVGLPVAGNGSDIFMETGMLAATTSFNVHTTNDLNSCEWELDTVVTVTVNTTVTPSVNISSSADGDSICAGDSVIFTALPVYGGASPAYQWKVNGVNEGSGDVFFATDAIADGDSVHVVLTSSIVCVTQQDVVSNKKGMKVDALVTPSVTISSDAAGDSVCAVDTLIFTAIGINGGSSPFYQWRVNDLNVGTDSSEYSSVAMNEGDKVNLVLTSNARCRTVNIAYSDTITVSVTQIATPIINQIGADTLQADVVADSYIWYLDEVDIQKNTRVIKTTGDGQYKVIAILNGCLSDESMGFDYVFVGIPYLTNAGIAVYPNPFSSELTVYSPQGGIARLYSADGVMVTGLVLTKGNNSIDLNELPAGLYFLKRGDEVVKIIRK